MGSKFLAMCNNEDDICDYIGVTQRHTLSQIRMYVNRTRSSISSKRPLGRVLRMFYGEAKGINTFADYKKRDLASMKHLYVMMHPSVNYFGCATSE